MVIIAAGYDTRAYRLASPGVSFYEIDLPHASKKKQELVAQHMPKDKVGRGSSAFLMGCLTKNLQQSPYPKPLH